MARRGGLRVSVDLGAAARPDDATVELLLGTRIPYLVGPAGTPW